MKRMFKKITGYLYHTKVESFLCLGKENAKFDRYLVNGKKYKGTIEETQFSEILKSEVVEL